MNKQGQIGQFALIFVLLFIVGGIIGSLSLPEFPGRFYLSGFLFAIFGTGAGAVIVKIIFNR